MTLIGTYTGARLTKFRNLSILLVISFILGVIITIAEPDLQVLAENTPHINTIILIITVSVGVGLFLMLCMLRILLGVQLRWILMFFYIIVFTLAFFADPDYISVAFDSGGVTTGPMTVPFIMAMGVGVASIRSDKNAEADSFGLVAPLLDRTDSGGAAAGLFLRRRRRSVPLPPSRTPSPTLSPWV